mmetsp:Transcript_26171/g.84712  ORF Transcript_26171/g.84712 Transcript_26171/m.84712 type:complete len:306 (+) Transcript_26171:1162-2079(+)
MLRGLHELVRPDARAPRRRLRRPRHGRMLLRVHLRLHAGAVRLVSPRHFPRRTDLRQRLTLQLARRRRRRRRHLPTPRDKRRRHAADLPLVELQEEQEPNRPRCRPRRPLVDRPPLRPLPRRRPLLPQGRRSRPLQEKKRRTAPATQNTVVRRRARRRRRLRRRRSQGRQTQRLRAGNVRPLRRKSLLPLPSFRYLCTQPIKSASRAAPCHPLSFVRTMQRGDPRSIDLSLDDISSFLLAFAVSRKNMITSLFLGIRTTTLHRRHDHLFHFHPASSSFPRQRSAACVRAASLPACLPAWETTTEE